MEEGASDNRAEDNHDNDADADDHDHNDDGNQHTDTGAPSDDTSRPTSRYNLRNREKLPQYGFRLAAQMNQSDHKTSYETKKNRKPRKVKEEQHEVQFTRVHTITDLNTPSETPTEDKDYTVDYVKSAMKKLEEDPREMLSFITHYLFVQLQAQDYGADAHKQMNGRAGVKKFGKKAVEALAKEMLQFLDLDVFEGIMADTLTAKQKKNALNALALIKLKRNLILKGRIVADGRKQREIYTKDETTSSTCHNDTIMLTLLIEAIERRAVATGNVSGAYSHAMMYLQQNAI